MNNEQYCEGSVVWTLRADCSQFFSAISLNEVMCILDILLAGQILLLSVLSGAGIHMPTALPQCAVCRGISYSLL